MPITVAHLHLQETKICSQAKDCENHLIKALHQATGDMDLIPLVYRTKWDEPDRFVYYYTNLPASRVRDAVLLALESKQIVADAVIFHGHLIWSKDEDGAFTDFTLGS